MVKGKTTKKKTSSKLTSLEKQINDLKALLPSQQDWRTTDEQEIIRRQIRALENPPKVQNLHPNERIHSNFEVQSPQSGRCYTIEVIDLAKRLFYSSSPDFSTSGLGACKHTEAVLFYLKKRFKRLFKEAEKEGPAATTLIIKNHQLYVHGVGSLPIPRKLRLCVDQEGYKKESTSEVKLIQTAKLLADEGVRVSAQVYRWISQQERETECQLLQRDYEQRVQSGEFPQHETLLPLFPYQRQGMLHLAFKERAMVADEMGLGKTIQAIAAALLHRIGKAQRCLIVAPASLKVEWEEQIAKFTKLTCEVVYGSRSNRCAVYNNPSAFFTIVNYEQVRSDSLDINAALSPDIVILDEAQRIKNWGSLTAQAIKRLVSRYAFVLTGTPIENRLDELYSIIEFLDPSIFGALFRFNREYHTLSEENGKPEGYKNLDSLRKKVQPIILRRRKSDVETELPDRTDENRFIQLTEGQKASYVSKQEAVRKLIHQSAKRPLRREEHQRLMGYLGMMRMLCDTEFILDKGTKESPKVDELALIFDQALQDPDTKIIVFSEWIGMLTLIRELLIDQKIGYAWHTGSVPQKKRRAEIQSFKQDPDCRILLCTESGGSGLNLQNASMVINCDLPWNPAKLEQRIARAWRKGQKRPVQVINLISQGSIEHAMLETLAVKQGLADGVLDGYGELSEIKLKRGGQSFLSRLEQTLEIGEQLAIPRESPTPPPKDPALSLSQSIQQSLGSQLLHCEEHFIVNKDDGKLYIVVEQLNPTVTKTVKQALLTAYPHHANESSWVEENVVLIDRPTHEAFLQLQRSGLSQTNARAKRNLLDSSSPTNSKPKLTEEQLKQIVAYTQTHQEQLKAATVLAAAGLESMAATHLKNTLLALSQIEAVKNFTTPAQHLEELSDEPHNSFLPHELRTFIEQPDWNSETAENLLTLLK